MQYHWSVYFVVNSLVQVNAQNNSPQKYSPAEIKANDEALASQDINKYTTYKYPVPNGDSLKLNELIYLPTLATYEGKNVCTSQIVTNYTTNLYMTGFQSNIPSQYMAASWAHQEQLRVCVLLHCPVSIDPALNTTIVTEFLGCNNGSSEFPLRTSVAAATWNLQWMTKDQDGKNVPVEYSVVADAFAQLKQSNPDLAEYFRWREESRVKVCENDLRDFLKGHEITNNYLLEITHLDPTARAYLHLLDPNASSYNGIYNAYTRIITCQQDFLPSIMSTGYEYVGDSVPNDVGGFNYVSEIDRTIRVFTSQEHPGGVYYPECNTCILYMSNMVMPMSFRFKVSFQAQDNPMAQLICNLFSLQTPTARKTRPKFVFSGDRPVILNTPLEERYSLTWDLPITFRTQFVKEGILTNEDLSDIRNQNTWLEYWIYNFFVNYPTPFLNEDLNTDMINHLHSSMNSLYELEAQAYPKNPQLRKEDRDDVAFVSDFLQSPSWTVVLEVIRIYISFRVSLDELRVINTGSEDKVGLGMVLSKYNPDYDIANADFYGFAPPSSSDDYNYDEEENELDIVHSSANDGAKKRVVFDL